VAADAFYGSSIINAGTFWGLAGAGSCGASLTGVAGDLQNLSSGTITAAFCGVELDAVTSTLSNAGAISGGDRGIHASRDAQSVGIHNDAGGAIEGGHSGVIVDRLVISTGIWNAGSISGNSMGVSDAGFGLVLENVAGGLIHGGAAGINTAS